MAGALARSDERCSARAARARRCSRSPSTSRRSRHIAATRRAADYLAGETDGTPNREIVLEEMLLLWLANENEGFAPHDELFDDDAARGATAYDAVIESSTTGSRRQPGFGPDDEDLVTLLREPALEGGADAWPTSCAGSRQLGLRRREVRRSAGHQPRRADRGGARALDALQRDPGRRRRHAPARRRGHGRRGAPRLRLRRRRARSRVRALQPRPRLDAAASC